MLVSPVAGAVSDRVGRRPVMVTGLTLQALGFAWVAARGSLATSWVELTLALLVAGIGISMALPTVPAAVLAATAPAEMGKASGINFMAQRLGSVFAIAIGSAIFSARGHLRHPRQRDRRLPARPVVLRRVRPAGGADRQRHQAARVRCGHRGQASRRHPRYHLNPPERNPAGRGRSAGGEPGELLIQGSAFRVGLGEVECAPVRAARLVVSPGATKQLGTG